MTAVALRRSPARARDAVRDRSGSHEHGVQAAAGREPSLDQLLVSAWDSLAANQSIDCPLCGQPMAPVYGAQAKPIGGRCGGCGTTLG